MKFFHKNIRFIYCLLLLGIVSAQPRVGFVPDGSNYYEAFSEGTDGVVYVQVTNVSFETTITFYVNVHTSAPSYGTANLANNDHGLNHYDDYNAVYWNNEASGSPNGTSSMAVQITVSSSGTYPVTVDVVQDYRYEGGSGGTPETINMYLLASTGCALESTAVGNASNEFVYKITDDDQPPVYAFENTSTQTVQENAWIGNTGRIIAVPHSDGNTYYAGTDDFTLTFTISNGTTSNADHRANGNSAGTVVGTLEITEAEQDNQNIRHYLTDDVLDEPNETFTITLSESDANGDLGANNSLSFIVEDHADDLPPYVKFRDANQTVSENGAPTVTIVAQLTGASGYDNVLAGYTVSGTAENSGSYADHNLSAGTIDFGTAGNTEKTFTFTLTDDAYDEGLDASVFETVIITLDESNLSNLRIDSDTYTSAHTLNIQDDDAAPTMSFSANTSITATSGLESVTTPTIKVVIDNPSALTITGTYANNTSGTATIYSDDSTPWDYKINDAVGSGSFSIAPYATEFALPITINSSEEFDEDNEEIKINVTAGNNVGGGTFTHTYTITDDDATPTLYFSNSASTLTSTENGSANVTDGTINVRLSAPSGKAVSYSLAVDTYDGLGYGSNGSDDDGDGDSDEANEGVATSSDFALNSTSGTISAYGTGTSSFTYTHYGDNTDELDKYVKLLVSLGSGESDATAASDGTQFQIIKLEDDDTPIKLGFASATDNGSEGDAAENIVVSKITSSGTDDTEFTVKTTIAVSNATATDGSSDDDYDLATSGGTAISAGSSQVLTFGPDDTNQSISIAIDNDDLYEGGSSGTPETVEFSLGTFVNSVTATNSTLTYSIVDDEDPPTIEFDVANSASSGAESSGTPTITVKTNRRSIFDSEIDYSAAAKTGTTTLTSGDYTLANGTARVNALGTSTTIPLTINDDDKYEIDESIRITLSNANSTSQIGSATIHDYTINANDSKPALSFTASSGTADASSPEEGDGSETITVSLAAVSGVASSVTYTITGTATAGVDFTDATSDYDSDPSTNIITWAADDATVDKTIVINFTDDVIDEGSETIIITLSGVSGGATNGSDLVHTITLQDSDAPPVMQFTNSTMTVNESEGPITIPLTLTHDGSTKQASDVGDATMTWTINGSGTATIDASSNAYPNDITSATTGTVTIAKGQTDGSITFTLNDDAIDEWNETFIVDLSNNNSFATASGNQSITVTIDDESDNAPTINFTTTSGGTGVTESASAASAIDIDSKISLNGISGKDLWFSYATEGSPGTATANQDYTPISGTFKIAAGSLTTTENIELPILSDDLDEINQTVKVTIAVLGADQNDDNSSYEATSDAETATDGNLVYTYTIEDDDAAPFAFFKNVDGTVGTEGGSIDEGEAKTITVALSSASEKDVILYYSDAGTGTATSATDYSAITAYTALGTISGAAGGGTTENTFSISTTEDAIDEENQTIAIQLQATSSATSDMPNVSNALVSGGSGAQAVVLYTLIITDDEDPPNVNLLMVLIQSS